MANDQLQVIHTDEVYEVTVTITQKSREIIVGKNYQNRIEMTTPPELKAKEVYAVQFTTTTQAAAVRRAVNHLKIIEGDE